MRLILTLVAALLLAPAAARAQHVVTYCDAAKTQIDFNFCAESAAGRAHSAMDIVYRRLLAKLEPAKARRLQRAQRDWYRQTVAECEIEAAGYEGGSIQPWVRNHCHEEATKARTARLRAFLTESTWAGGTEGQHEVIAAAESLFVAMRGRDTTALRALLHPRATIVAISERGVRVRTADEWIPGVAQSPEVLVERLWDAEVRIDGELATLWAPYDFYRGPRFSHCGMDAFQFVREGGVWKLVAITFTVRTEGCEPPARWDPRERAR